MHLVAFPVLAILSLFSAPAAAAEAVTNCDRLAASPDDPKRNAPAVEFNRIKGAAAEAACRSAVKASPDVARFQFELGRALDAEEQYDQAMTAYQAAFAKGYAAAADAIGVLYQQDSGPGVDYAKAAKFYQLAIDAGDLFAASDLALLHQDGKGFDKSTKAAAPLFRKAAEAGYPPAQVGLGYLYEYGDGVEKDAHQAVDWYRKAADQGFADGEFDLALMYRDGSGVEKNVEEAIRLLRLSADQDDGNAILELARYARDGTGMAIDQTQAEKLFRRVIDSGDDDTVWRAEDELALMFAKDGRNLDEAAKLAGKAVEALPEEGEDRSSALDASAWVTHLRHEDAKALPLAEKAIKGDNQYAPYHDHLGDILLALGHKDRAATEWQKALDLDPPDPADDWDREAVVKKLAAFASEKPREQEVADPNAPTIGLVR